MLLFKFRDNNSRDYSVSRSRRKVVSLQD